MKKIDEFESGDLVVIEREKWSNKPGMGKIVRKAVGYDGNYWVVEVGEEDWIDWEIHHWKNLHYVISSFSRKQTFHT